MMMSSELKSHLVDKLKDSAADGKTVSRAYMGRAWSGPEFHVNSGWGRVGSLHLWVGSGQENWTNIQMWRLLYVQ